MYRVVSISLLLGLTLVATSCMSLTPVGAPTQVSQSYDLPKDLDANAVIHAVQQSFTQALSTAPRIVEGAVPNPLPARPLRFTLHSRTAHLDHLGSVLIPSVTCPQHLAVISAWPENPDSLGNVHHYTACIQPYAEGYRVTIIVSTPHVQHPLRNELTGQDDDAPVSRIAKILLTEISLVGGHAASALEPVISHAHATGRDPFQGHQTHHAHQENPLPPERHSAALRPLHAPAALPLVCLAPKDHAAMLQSQPGGGKVIGTVEMGSVMAVAEPLDTSYFKVEMERGSAGWISRSEVTRLPCPVG
ncbi:MAG: hypothetical protein M3Z35_03100 [Nitrospirota bacterium]|nr:hypothetical protein [Nitrospirota bacterium]